MEPSGGGLPAVSRVGAGAPFRWLGGAWRDLWTSPLPCLSYGLALSLFSMWLALTVYRTSASFWIFALACGFVFVAPMLAMGLYEAGRLLERGERPTLGRMVFVRSALRQDLAYLGLALLLVFLIWGGVAQVVYGLSTYQIHRTVPDFLAFALGDRNGRVMVVVGSIIGGAIAYLTFCFVAVSAPMLLDRRNDMFVAMITSVRAVTRNFGAMTLWAALIAALVLLAALSGFLGLILVFPWLGLASWRAYRDLVPSGASTVNRASAAG